MVAAHPDDGVLGCGGTIAGHADSDDQVQVLVIEEGSKSRQPQVVYLRHAYVVNLDHCRLDEPVVTACRPTPGHPLRRLSSCEVASSSGWQQPSPASAFQPNWFVDICDEWQRKRNDLWPEPGRCAGGPMPAGGADKW